MVIFDCQYIHHQKSSMLLLHVFSCCEVLFCLSSLSSYCCLYQAFAGSDVSELSFGSPINASALLIILLHQVLESHTLVRNTFASSPVPLLFSRICQVDSSCLFVVVQTWIHALVLLLSALSYFGFVLFFSLFCVTCSPPTNPLGVETLQMSQPIFYIICMLTTVTALIPRYTHLQ